MSQKPQAVEAEQPKKDIDDISNFHQYWWHQKRPEDGQIIPPISLQPTLTPVA